MLRLQRLKSTAAYLALLIHHLQHTIEALPFIPFVFNKPLLIVNGLLKVLLLQFKFSLFNLRFDQPLLLHFSFVVFYLQLVLQISDLLHQGLMVILKVCDLAGQCV